MHHTESGKRSQQDRKAQLKKDRDRADLAGSPDLAKKVRKYRSDLRRRRGLAETTSPLLPEFWEAIWVDGRFWTGGPEAPSTWMADGRPQPPPSNA